jgi:hypothetical protein
MALVYGRHRDVIGSFPDTGYLVTLLERCIDYEERDRLVCLLAQLVVENHAHQNRSPKIEFKPPYKNKQKKSPSCRMSVCQFCVSKIPIFLSYSH